MSTKEQKSGWFSNLLKNLFFLLLIIQLIPLVFSTIKNQIKKIVTPNTEVGCITIKDFLLDSTSYIKQINKYLKDSSIKGLLLKIDCPGGYPGTPQAIFNELKKFKEKKPVVTLVENICTSGAYYIAAASNDIIASPSSYVGSIGVYSQLPNIKSLAEKYNVRVKLIQAGKFKTVGNLFKDETAEDNAYLQSLADDIYNQFVSDIATSRNLNIDKKNEWADGKVFTASTGLKEHKLVDKIGSITDAKTVLKQRIEEYGMKSTGEIKLIHAPSRSKISSLLFGKEEEDEGTESDPTEICSSFLDQVWNKFLSRQKMIPAL